MGGAAESLRADILSRARTVVVKVGSAVLTCGAGLDARAIGRLVDQLSMLHDRGLKVVLVSSGAVAAGRTRIRQSVAGAESIDFSELPSRQAASAIGQSRLMHEYDQEFGRFGKTVAQILLTREDLKSRKRFLNARNTMRRLLDWGVIPVINENDTVAVAELEFGDNDTLASLIVDLVGAELFVNLTSAGGVFDKNPDKHPDACCLPVIEDVESLDIEGMCDGKTSVGSGGMYSKLRAARRAAQLGGATLIVSGREDIPLDRVFRGEALGTLVLPWPHGVAPQFCWPTTTPPPAGAVGRGRGQGPREKGKSQLPPRARR
jgi:glutamate 5-kinase